MLSQEATENPRKKDLRKGKQRLSTILLKQKLGRKTQRQEVLLVPWHVRRSITLKVLVRHAKQKGGKHLKIKTRCTKHEVNVMVQKRVKKALKQKKKDRAEELRAFDKISVSNSDQESIDSNSSEEGQI